MGEVAAALLDASRKLSDKDNNKSFGSSAGNVSMGSGFSWASNTESQDKQQQMSTTKSPTSSWLSNPWEGSRQRTMSDCVSNSEKLSTMAWLGGWPLLAKNGENLQVARPNDSSHFSQFSQNNGQDKRVRRASCKGIESAMAGGMGKVWYDS